jgi:hypothetical protein
MSPKESPTPRTRDRRAKERRASSAAVRLIVEGQEVPGRADDISHSGILFFTDHALRVTIEIESPSGVTRRTGRLVRAQVMSPERIGWAVEFERE